MKLNFRKIASVLAGTAMLSLTLAFAAAANYPDPFVKSAGGDVAIVYGSQPGGQYDVVAASNINTNLQAALARLTATTGTSGSASTISGGDFKNLINSDSNKINLRDTITGVFGTTVSDDHLKTLLADGVFQNDENSDYKYDQTITLGTGLQLNYFVDSNYKDSAQTAGFNMSGTQSILNYTLDFTTDPESDVSSSDLVDLEAQTFKMLGREYYILDADNSTFKLTLLDAANTAVIKEGETKTIVAGAKSYDVKIDAISSTEVRLVVGTETSKSLQEGETYKLSDGTHLGIKDIFDEAVAGSIGSVEISIGSGKLELTHGAAIELNDKTFDDVTAYLVKGTPAGSGRERWDKLVLEWKNDDVAFLTPDSPLTLPGFENLKLSMSNFYTPAAEVTEIRDGSDLYSVLKTEIQDGAVSIPLLFSSDASDGAGNFTGIGESATKRLVTSSLSNVLFNESRGDEWLVASWNSSTSAESYLLTMTVSKTDGLNKTKIYKWQDGSKLADPVCDDKGIGSTCTLGSLTLTITNVSTYTGEKTVNLTAGSGGNFFKVFTKAGMQISLPYVDGVANTTDAMGAINITGTNVSGFEGVADGHNRRNFALFFTEEDRNGNIIAGNSFNVTIVPKANGDVEVSTYDVQRAQITDVADSDNRVNKVYSDLATEVWRIGDSSAQRTGKVIYSGGEAYADVVLSETGVSVTSSDTATTGGATVSELGSVIVTDAEVASVTGKNLIVVGGSCVNTLASQLLGGAGCGQSFQDSTTVGSGSFLIQTFDRGNGKVATLVAGYNLEDTMNAGKFLTTQVVDTSVGKKYVGTTATSAQLVSTTPAATTP